MIIFVALIVALPILYFVYLSYRLYRDFKFYTKQGLTIDLFYPFRGAIHYQIKGSKEHGDVFYYLKEHTNKKVIMSNQNFRPLLLLTDSQMIKEYLMIKSEQFYGFTSLQKNPNDFKQSGLIQTDGQQWKKQRRILSQAFHFGFLQKLLPFIIKITQENLDSIQNLDEVDVLAEFSKSSADFITRMFFGKSFSQIKVGGIPISLAVSQTQKAVTEQQKSIRYAIFGKFFRDFQLTEKDRKLAKVIKEFRDIARKTIQERRENLGETYDKDPNRKDLLQVLLDQEPENQLTEEELIGNFITFFVAGTDTTANSMTALIWFLSQNQEVLDKVYNEINQHVKSQEDITWENLNKLTYIDACIKETLRLMNPPMRTSTRYATQDVKIGDLLIKKDTLVYVPVLLNTFGRGLINENEFNPDRWINGEMENVDGFYKIPFGSGARNCIGQHLAQLELRVITIIFLRKFTYQTLQPTEFKNSIRGFLVFKKPFIAKLIPRYK